MSARQVETVETIASYARRTEHGVRLVLHLPEAEAAGATEGRVRLTSKRGSVKAAARIVPVEPGTRIEVDFPARRLPPDVWKIAVRLDAEAPFRRVQARLLTSRTQPIALLTGPRPRTRMAPPEPQRNDEHPRIRGAARRMARRVLDVMPEKQAAKVRAAARRSVR